LELQYPARVVDPADWLEHIPFAFWLVENLRPNTLIELGLGSGNSYCAFLQAVRTLGLATQCVGISPERGEAVESTGRAALDELKAYHDPLYATFSTLVRGSLAEARVRFADESIDLLHVDVPTVDDAVAHDLYNWFPKMGSRGVILLHGIEAGEQHRGAQILWQVLASRYPTFAFVHARGLGVAYVGSEPLSGSLETLFQARDQSEIADIRAYFSRLGTSVAERYALHQAKGEIARRAAEANDRIAPVTTERNFAIQTLRQQTLAAMQPERERTGPPARALWTKLVQGAPRPLKNLIPLPVKHYLLRLLPLGERDSIGHDPFLGTRSNIDPVLSLQTQWLYPFFASVGLHDPPVLTVLAYRSAGYATYSTRADAERVAQIVRASRLFDEQYYLARAGNIGDLDPVLHYVIVGERMGFAPSDRFDPVYYYERYRDLRGLNECLLVHYLTLGRIKGRRAVSLAAEFTFDQQHIDPQRETILVVSHDASRSGAPILAYNIVKRLRAKYNVVALLLSGGDIVAAFADVSNAVVGPFRHADLHPVEAEYLARRLLSTYRISYAIANSIESRIVMRPLACAFVPVVALVHEFASHLRSKGEMGRELGWATQTVFSAERVLDSVRAEYPNIDNYRLHILPQGPPELPHAKEPNEDTRQSLRAAVRPEGWENAFVVLGCGTVYPRKGVDLFFSCAAKVAAHNSKRRIRFVWIGQRLPAKLDDGYFPQLLEQIEQSGIADKAVILEAVDDLEPAYALADAFFLSSRLDPLPNVAIDSALRGIPVVCFQDCSGISDILATDSTTRLSVVPHLDVDAAAKLILTLAADEAMRQDLGVASRRLAEATFDMERYIVQLDNIGREAMRVMEQRRRDFATIEADGMFDTIGFLGPDSEIVTREGAIRLFLAKAAMLGTGRQPTVNFYYRRPSPGFHPQIYAYENRNCYDIALENPLAHFIRSGKPAGPWSNCVITPDSTDDESINRSKLRIAMHVHFHYPELCGEFLEMMAANSSRCDLLLTTNSRGKARALKRRMAKYDRGEVRVTLVPNRGRDIGAFLTALRTEVMEQYDLIGHLHSKRSLFIGDRLVGERWRKFIWRNLIGGRYPMMDIVLRHMVRDARLGIVFPDDPHLSDWDCNLEIAQQLVREIGIEDPLPPFFNFPVGTMFWARSAALAPLFKLGLNWDSYPEEPVPIDGTILHAIERILPLVAQHAGYHYATTQVPGVTW
jgi:glycosyltransferase involved in cell wall biosynthesis